MQITNNDKIIDKLTNSRVIENNNTNGKSKAQNELIDTDLIQEIPINNGTSKSKNNGYHNGFQDQHQIDEQISQEENDENHESSNKHENHRVLPSHENKVDLLTSENTVEIAFQGSRKEFFYNSVKDKLHPGDYVVVETENGCDFGKVSNIGELVFKKWSLLNKLNKTPVYSIKYKASQKDIDRYHANLEEQTKILEHSKEIIKLHKLEMRVTEVEWQYDRHRLTIFFLAPQRVDFRELVKDLAKEYKTRIELRQITHRERARRITLWEGVCGRGICCSTFLSHIKPITIEHSKIQQLSANVTKLSGYCGRLKCCLAFEYEFYSEESARFPKLGSILDMEDTTFKLIKFDIFKDILTFFSDERRIYRNFSLEEISEFAKQNKILEPKESVCPVCDGFASQDELQELLSLADS